MLRTWALLIAASMACLPAAAAVAQTDGRGATVRAEDDGPIVARVGGEPIRETDLSVAETALADAVGEGRRELPTAPGERRERLIDIMIEQSLAARAATAAKLEDSTAIKGRIAALRDRVLHDVFLDGRVKAEVTPAVIRKTYDEENAPEQRTEVRIRQILLGTQAEADRAVARLRAGETFVRVAIDMTRDRRTRAMGGDLGFVRRDDLAPDVAAAAFRLKRDEVSGVVRSLLGWHILQLLERRLRPAPSFEETRETIEYQLADGVRTGTIDALRKAARIERLPALTSATIVEGSEEVVARVDGRAVTAGDLAALSRDPSVSNAASDTPERRASLLDTAIERRLAAQAATTAGLQDGAAFRRRFRFERDRALAEAYFEKELAGLPTPATIKAFYGQDFERVSVRYRSIHLPDRPMAMRAADRLRRGAVMQKIADELGDKVYFTETKEFEAVNGLGRDYAAALARLRPGGISEPFRQVKVWVVAQLLERRDKPPLAEVEDDLRAYLIRQAREEILLTLRSETEVERRP